MPIIDFGEHGIMVTTFDGQELTSEEIEADFKIVAAFKDKNEKLSWSRKQKKLEEYIEQEVNPLAEKIAELQVEHQKIIDEIIKQRSLMVKECIHPKNSLIHHGTYIECKFCNAKLSIPKKKS